MDIDMDINMDVDNDHDENEEIFKIETMEPGINAKTEEEMVKAIDAWCQKNFIPLTKVRRKAPGTNTKGDRVRGQRGYKCAHGVERQSKTKKTTATTTFWSGQTPDWPCRELSHRGLANCCTNKTLLMYLWSVKVSTSLLLLLPPEEQVQPHGAGCSWKLRDYLLWSSRPRPEAGEDQKLKTSGKELLLHQDA